MLGSEPFDAGDVLPLSLCGFQAPPHRRGREWETRQQLKNVALKNADAAAEEWKKL